MALYYKLPVYKASLALVRAVYECSSNFAREYKYTTGQDMKKVGTDLVLNIYRANKSADKTPAIEMARENVETIRLYVTLMRDFRQVSLKEYAAINLHIDDVGKQLTAWEKYCRRVTPPGGSGSVRLPESPVVRAQASEQRKSNSPLAHENEGEEYRPAKASGATGRVSGSDPEPATKSAVIPPPVAGNRNRTSGGMNNVGSNGNYWSSSVTGTNARHLNVNGGDVNPANTNNRGNGFSVRCLKDLHTYV
jgi:Fibrobacter succinogenes major domain (Fib_succ_major).